MFGNGFSNNSFGGYNSNNFNPASKNLASGNVAGINKGPSSVAGVSSGPSSVAGMNKMPTQQDRFANVQTGNSGPAKQVMNSQGQNMIHNDFRGIKN